MSSKCHYVLMAKVWHLELWSGILAILAAMGAPWMTFVAGGDFGWQALAGAILGSIVAGAAAGKLWLDDRLTKIQEQKREAREAKIRLAEAQHLTLVAPLSSESESTDPDVR